MSASLSRLPTVDNMETEYVFAAAAVCTLQLRGNSLATYECGLKGKHVRLGLRDAPLRVHLMKVEMRQAAVFGCRVMPLHCPLDLLENSSSNDQPDC